MGGRPHWAKNWAYTSSEQIDAMFGNDMQEWMRVRNDADPEGMFLGEWHRRDLPFPADKKFALEEREITRSKHRNGGQYWVGEVKAPSSDLKDAYEEEKPSPLSPSASSSDESFNLMHEAEAERSGILGASWASDEMNAQETERTDAELRRTHGRPA